MSIRNNWKIFKSNFQVIIRTADNIHFLLFSSYTLTRTVPLSRKNAGLDGQYAWTCMSNIMLNLHFASGCAKEVERNNARILFKKRKKNIVIFYIWDIKQRWHRNYWKKLHCAAGKGKIREDFVCWELSAIPYNINWKKSQTEFTSMLITQRDFIKHFQACLMLL